MELYNFILRGLPEIKRDCSNCPKETQFLKETKCCTYQPIVANFLIGMAMDENPDINQSLLNHQVVLTNLGVAPSLEYRKKFNSYGKFNYGQRKELVCCFFENGKCSIYKSRNSTCRSYYCLMDKNQLKQSSPLEEKAFDAEIKLAQLIAIELGCSWRDIEMNLNYINEESLSLKEIDKLEFYIECFRHYKVNQNRLHEEVINTIGIKN